MASRSNPQGYPMKSGRSTMDVGSGQTVICDGGPSRGEEMMNYNPTLKKGGEAVGGGPDNLSHSISAGKVPSIQK